MFKSGIATPTPYIEHKRSYDLPMNDTLPDFINYGIFSCTSHARLLPTGNLGAQQLVA